MFSDRNETVVNFQTPPQGFWWESKLLSDRPSWVSRVVFDNMSTILKNVSFLYLILDGSRLWAPRLRSFPRRTPRRLVGETQQYSCHSRKVGTTLLRVPHTDWSFRAVSDPRMTKVTTRYRIVWLVYRPDIRDGGGPLVRPLKSEVREDLCLR